MNKEFQSRSLTSKGTYTATGFIPSPNQGIEIQGIRTNKNNDKLINAMIVVAIIVTLAVVVSVVLF